MNRIILTGRLTKEIELKYTQNNTAVIKNTIAVQRNFKNANGEYDTDFISLDIWGARADYLSKYGNKGDKVLVSGWLKTDNYEKDGKKIQTFSIVVEDLEILTYTKNKETTKQETPEKPKAKLDDSIFEEFGNQIEINDKDLAF